MLYIFQAINIHRFNLFPTYCTGSYIKVILMCFRSTCCANVIYSCHTTSSFVNGMFIITTIIILILLYIFEIAIRYLMCILF